jgi:hypothetical protein
LAGVAGNNKKVVFPVKNESYKGEEIKVGDLVAVEVESAS